MTILLYASRYCLLIFTVGIILFTYYYNISDCFETANKNILIKHSRKLNSVNVSKYMNCKLFSFHEKNIHMNILTKTSNHSFEIKLILQYFCINFVMYKLDLLKISASNYSSEFIHAAIIVYSLNR